MLKNKKKGGKGSKADIYEAKRKREEAMATAAKVLEEKKKAE